MMSVKGESVRSFHESFYGTPTAEETRRRRGKKRHPARKEEPRNEVAVIGTHYRSFDDDSMAAFVNSATALVPWNGDSKLLIDRYDVRHLLQDLTGIRRRRARPPSPDATKEELDYERYRDVAGLENPSPPEDDELQNENSTGGGYQSVGFNYSNGGDHSSHKERVEEALFSPPFFVPEHLRMQIPTSTKVHQIMAGTAKYVIEHGGQAEIVLRVKQANNPTFGFLMPDHNDHEYFRFLVGHPEYVGIGPSSQPVAAAEVAVAASSEEAEGGLSLLGTAYGDADEDEEDHVSGDQAQEEQVVAAEVHKSVDDVTKQQSDGNSDNVTTSNRSSTINRTASDVGENATKDTGDSHDTSLGSRFPGSAVDEETSDVPVGGEADALSGLQEPAPPGMEASGSEEADGREAHSLSGDLNNQVPPYKEPPLQLRRIIDKMVEFISRNGKEFEAVVKERDKSDHRFPFFQPSNEYYAYYSQELEAARQVQASGEAVAVAVPLTSESPKATAEQVAEKDRAYDSFLSGVPYGNESWTTETNDGKEEEQVAEKDKPYDSFLSGVPYGNESWTTETNDGKEKGGVSDMQDNKTDTTHNGDGGMDFDAVLAAVRFATRGRPRAVEGGEDADLLKVSDGHEQPEMGSDEAVLAAIKAATGRTTLNSSGSGGKGDVVQVAGSSEAATGRTNQISSGPGGKGDVVQVAGSSEAALGMATDPVKRATSLPLSNGVAPVVMDRDDVVVPHLVSAAVAVAGTGDGDSPEPQLASPEKRKAERLRKAKLFAAMIKEKNGSVTNPGQLSASVGIAVPTPIRLNHSGVAVDSTSVKSEGETLGASSVVEPKDREQTGEAKVQVAPETEKGESGSGSKERKHKGKSKGQEEKQRRHHRRRKKDTEDGEIEKHSPETGEERTDEKHDHYQEGKRKDRKHGLESDGKGKDGTRRRTEGKIIENRSVHDFEDRREFDEARKDRSYYAHDSESKRKESKYGHEAEQRRTGSRHVQDSEGDWKESRYGHDAQERRREYRHNELEDQKRRDSRHRHDSEENRSGDRYAYEKEERRKERSRSHGKRRKHKDLADDSDDKEDKRKEHRSKKSRRHGDDFPSAAEHMHAERQSAHQRDLQDDRSMRDAEPAKQDPSGGTGSRKVSVVVPKSTLSSEEVPDDIRAKVRAMLAMM